MSQSVPLRRVHPAPGADLHDADAVPRVPEAPGEEPLEREAVAAADVHHLARGVRRAVLAERRI